MTKDLFQIHSILINAKSLLKTTKGKIIFIIIIAALGFWGFKTFGNKPAAPQYQTAQAEKGTLVTSVSASGTISSGNNLAVTTNTTGTVSQVYVNNGDTIAQGQKIAEITLDQESEQKQAAAWASYLSTKNQLAAAQAKINSLQSAEFKANQKFINDAVVRNLPPEDPTWIQENADWLQAEADYKNQTGVISQAQASLNSSWLAYQQLSSTITAPTDGVISNMIIAPGSVISQSSSSNNTTTAQKLGTITKPQDNIQATVNLSEIDVAKVKIGQKATITLDAFANKTFTGKILMINTNGTVSSGVTTYPATIIFDTSADNIYPNMAVAAKIITNIKDNIILVPSTAIQTANNQTTVRVMNKGKVESITVESGDSNDTQTEIVSGIKEGDLVVTNILNTTNSKPTTQNSSPFGGGNRGFGGGGAVRIAR